MEFSFSLFVLLITFLLPLLVGGLIFFIPLSSKLSLRLNTATQFVVFCSSLYFFRVINKNGSLSFFSEWLRLDSLTTLYFLITGLCTFLTAAYSQVYFSKEALPTNTIRRFLSLWSLTISMGILVLVSNNIALMWVALEATTVFSAFLICAQKSKKSLEAMWKYLILCTIGVAFAFIGTLLIRVSAQNLQVPLHDILLWTTLNEYAPILQTTFVKAGFIFLLVGYGTKAGIAPMHTWMPDAYSHAPAPLGALSSGILINLAVYALSRFIPIAEKATVFSGWAYHLLVIMGSLTLVIATAFILFQQNIKRLLAYSSIEHIGVITLALGLPGAGVFAAFYHSFNHALAKSFAFFCAGRLRQIYGTHDIKNFSSAMRVTPVWALGFLVALLTLIGAAPFAIFMSKFQVFKAIIHQEQWIPLFVLSITSSLVFISVLRYVLNICWKKSEKEITVEKSDSLEKGLVLFSITLLILLCLWLPSDLRETLEKASILVTGIQP